MPKHFLVEVSQKRGFASFFQTIFSLGNPLRCSTDKWAGNLRKRCSKAALKLDFFFFFYQPFEHAVLVSRIKFTADETQIQRNSLTDVCLGSHNYGTIACKHHRLIMKDYYYLRIFVCVRDKHTAECAKKIVCLREAKYCEILICLFLKRFLHPDGLFRFCPQGGSSFSTLCSHSSKKALGGFLILKKARKLYCINVV